MNNQHRIFCQKSAQKYKALADQMDKLTNGAVEILNADNTPRAFGTHILDNMKWFVEFLDLKRQAYEAFGSEFQQDEITQNYMDACQTEYEIDTQCTTIALASLDAIHPAHLEQIMNEYNDANINMYFGNLMFGLILRQSETVEDAETQFEAQLKAARDQLN